MEKIFEMLESLEKRCEKHKERVYANYDDIRYGMGTVVGYEDAIEDLRGMIYEAYPPFYFTFGTDPQFPYGIDDYVVVRAENLEKAVAKFKEKHPNRPGSKAVNCAFWYTGDKWQNDVHKYYEGREPAEVIL